MTRVSPPSPTKIALIGSHGVGKTTLCFGLAARLKSRDMSLEVVHEVARRCPLPINEATSLEAQSWILHTQIAEELVAQARYPVVLCDRAVLDNYVYSQLAHGPEPRLDRLVDDWIETYQLLILVPITEVPQADGLRAVDPGFQHLIETRLRQELRRRELPFEDLGALPRDKWLDRVEAVAVAQLEPPQLSLL